ncbi:enoyl-CoA hydratase-related protein [Rhodococcus sp. T2V]|uniref:enoyl-CoA hydratase-related protein n=1 Tax=Rhodococcus sp. T2V TaxID=3034164 RepID=UPI0023E271DD|nr:enoyl-CoA hydratase-related protein [Rhodococcus sp. T2V]MDF3313516.1 enoyl-CoA hydratase-related protein [Rhodococcus sp. T2V]
MRILLLVSAFNGLSQRAWDELRRRGHHVTTTIAVSDDAVSDAVFRAQPDLILCPYLKERVPERVWRRWRTIIIHPGAVGDRGPSALDYAIMDGAPVWGVTALQATQEFDGGPVWAHREFPMPAEPMRKSALYNGPVADAAIACILEVIEKATDPGYVPTPLEAIGRPIPGTRPRPAMTQQIRAFSWSDPAADIVRRIRAADGSPGVRTQINGQKVHAFDAHIGGKLAAPTAPGTVIGRHRNRLLVAAGDASVWIGTLREPGGIKLPAAHVLPVAAPLVTDGPRDIRYRRRGPVGELTFDFYNGAAGVDQCRRLAQAIRAARWQDTRVLILRGGPEMFCHGIHLNEIEAADNPATRAWENIKAINTVCRALVTNSHQLTVAAFTGNAGAGGVMMALGADVVAARDGVVLNPYYDIGLYGSELHTLTLPRRVGAGLARQLLDEKLPIGARLAAETGLVDLVGPGARDDFDSWLDDLANGCADPVQHRAVVSARDPLTKPIDYYETHELSHMARDMFDNRHGFAEKRHAFTHKAGAGDITARLPPHRRADSRHADRETRPSRCTDRGQIEPACCHACTGTP